MSDEPATALVGCSVNRYTPFIMDRREFKALRENLHLTQQIFGEMLGFGKPGARMRVSEIERGDMPLKRSVEILCLYIDYFGLIPEHQKLRAKGAGIGKEW